MAQKALFIQSNLRVTQSRFSDANHSSRNAVDFANYRSNILQDTKVYAPYDCKAKILENVFNAILIESVDPVESPRGKTARQWMIICHANSFQQIVSDSHNNDIVIPKGTYFYDEGDKGAAADAIHIHVQCGWVDEQWVNFPVGWGSGERGSNIEDCLFVPENVAIEDTAGQHGGHSLTFTKTAEKLQALDPTHVINCPFIDSGTYSYIKIKDEATHFNGISTVNIEGAVDVSAINSAGLVAQGATITLPCNFRVININNVNIGLGGGANYMGSNISGVIMDGAYAGKRLYMDNFAYNSITLIKGHIYSKGQPIGTTGTNRGQHVHLEMWEGNDTAGTTARYNRALLLGLILGRSDLINGNMSGYYSTGGSSGPGGIGGPGGGATPPTDAQMQEARNAVGYSQENIAIANAQKATALAYLGQAQTYHNTSIAQKQAAEQRVRDTEPRVDALIAKTNSGLAVLTPRIDEVNETLAAVGNRLLLLTSPATGQNTGLETAFEDLFQLHRDNALTADEYDELGLTAEQYYALGLTAYSYDVEGVRK